MDKKHIITIAGKLGSGKSTTAKMVANILNYEHRSTGDFFRSMAAQRGLSTVELNKLAETDMSIDRDADNKNLEIGSMKNVVLDSRLGFYFIPDSFKVFLELNPKIAAKRILEDKKNNLDRHNETSNLFDTEEQIMNSILERLSMEKNRYKEIYGIEDNMSHKNFDLVIDTENISPKEVSQKIVEEYNNWLNH